MIYLIVIISAIGLVVSFFLSFLIYKIFVEDNDFLSYESINDIFHSADIDQEFLNDEESLINLANEYDFTVLSPEEQQSFLKGEEFTKLHQPSDNARGKSFTRQDELIIKDCGINAFEFEQERDILTARYIVEDRTEVNFLNNDTSYSTATAVLNLPLPTLNRTPDTIYFEVKIYEFNADIPNAHLAIGLVTKPYPSGFRLPGYNNFSLAYESTGNLKINKPFPTPLQQHNGDLSLYNARVLPPLRQSDVIGIGYVVPSGTLFLTKNGRKLMDIMKGCYVDLYPAIGCFSTNAKFQTNLGQMGFVWIEANVRRYGFFSTSDRKLKGERGLASLPEYGNTKLQNDKLLDKGEELPPDYPDEEIDFFGRVIIGSSSKFHQKKLDENSLYEPKE